jgi:hypothetical protein
MLAAIARLAWLGIGIIEVIDPGDASKWEHLLLSWARVLILEEMEPAENFRSPT